MNLSAVVVGEVHAQLLQRMDLRRTDIDRMADDDVRELARRHLREIIEERLPGAVADLDRVENLLLQEVVGLGPLEDLLADPAVTEIMVNGPADVFVECGGKLQRSSTRFSSPQALSRVVDRLLLRSGRRIDESSPMVDARLWDGSRVNVIIAPLSLRGAAITIRKFARQILGLEDLVKRGALSTDMAAFLKMAIELRCNIVVSGGTGTGKTTLLNCLSTLIPDGERIVTIEDSAELQLQHANLVQLEARPSNAEGRGLITIRDLVRNALRMRPDRIVIGECRGGEALDMLQAMNTGHDGSLTTAHANSPRDLLSRLEVMVLMAGMELPLAAIREQVAGAVDLVVQLTRYPCGRRLISLISEVTGAESGRIQLQDLFRFDMTAQGQSGSVQGEFRGCGNVPHLLERLEPVQRQQLMPWFEGRPSEIYSGRIT